MERAAIMRWLLGFIGLLLVLWCGWWFAGRSLIESQMAEVIAAERAKGAEVTLEDLSVSGFPSRFDVTTRAIGYRDPSGRFEWSGEAAHLYAMSWKPWHLILSLPHQQKIGIEGRDFTLANETLHVSLRSAPNRDLPLKEARVTGTSVIVTDATNGQFLWNSDEFMLALRKANEAEAGAYPYDFWAEGKGIALDPSLAAALAAQVGATPERPALPAKIDLVQLGLTAALSAPVDRHLKAPPEVSALVVRDVTLQWGGLSLTASGNLAPDAMGVASGQIDLRLKGWDYVPDLLIAAGKLPQERAALVRNMLASIAKDEGDGEGSVVSMPLIFKDGWVNLGPFPLGPAPVLGSALLTEG